MGLEELKKQFIVDRDKYHEEKLPDLIKRVLSFCKVDKTGAVFFESTKFTNADKIRLILLSRFLANKLDRTIPATVTIDEISKFTDLEKKIIAARIKELMDQKVVKRERKGTYSIYHYKIEFVLDKLEKKAKK